MSKEDQRREYNEQKELENLRRVFEAIDKNRDSKLDAKELNAVLVKLGYTAKKQEIEDMIWEVDEDCDKCVSWEEFKLMFERCRHDKTGLEPRKLFNVVEFIMHDKNQIGSIDLDEAITLLYARFGKEPVDKAMSEINTDDGTSEKSMSFTTMTKIQTAATKITRNSGLKAGATMVPQVKGLSNGDPSLAHLL